MHHEALHTSDSFLPKPEPDLKDLPRSPKLGPVSQQQSFRPLHVSRYTKRYRTHHPYRVLSTNTLALALDIQTPPSSRRRR
jgi:hypothetical protein